VFLSIFQSFLLLLWLSPVVPQQEVSSPTLSNNHLPGIVEDYHNNDDCHIQWLTPVKHDFGTITQGKPVSIIFRFQNEGTKPVILQTARTTCGCTAAQWTETAVEPGAEGEISIEYDAYRRGKFHKKIWIFFDCQQKPMFLHVKGMVRNK